MNNKKSWWDGFCQVFTIFIILIGMIGVISLGADTLMVIKHHQERISRLEKRVDSIQTQNHEQDTIGRY